jgi:hypothetical protein
MLRYEFVKGTIQSSIPCETIGSDSKIEMCILSWSAQNDSLDDFSFFSC